MKTEQSSFFRRIRHRIWVASGAITLTFVFFLVLPLMQAINKPPVTDMTLQGIDTANIPPPPPPMEEEEPEEEEEQEPEPPELTEEAPPLDLAQLELALNPVGGDGWMGGDFTNKLNTVGSGKDEMDAVFSLADLDQRPRVIFQPGPALTKQVRAKAPGKVYVLFIVNQRGAVENPVIQKSDNPVFEKPALNAVKKWKFEPGKRNGEAVRFRMRVPIVFPKG